MVALDEIAWLLNLRGSDIPFNPVFFAYCIISADNIDLFLGNYELSPALSSHLAPINARIHHYSEIFDFKHSFENILSSASCSIAIQMALGKEIKASPGCILVIDVTLC